MKKFLFILLLLPIISCGDQGDSGDNSFFKKKNISSITSHEIGEDIPDSAAVKGEYVYVPVYSSIYFKDSTRVYNLSATLSIRNIDTVNEIYVKEINYNNSRGENVKKFLKKAIKVKPLETFDLVIDEDDTSGGIGANFIVKWISRHEVQSPIIESVMISIRQGVGLSFTEPGRVIKKIR